MSCTMIKFRRVIYGVISFTCPPLYFKKFNAELMKLLRYKNRSLRYNFESDMLAFEYIHTAAERLSQSKYNFVGLIFFRLEAECSGGFFIWVCCGEKFFFSSIRLGLRSIIEDRLYHSFDFADDLYFELEYHVLWSDHLPVAITLQLETCRMPRTLASFSPPQVDEDELSRSPTLAVSPEYIYVRGHASIPFGGEDVIHFNSIT